MILTIISSLALICSSVLIFLVVKLRNNLGDVLYSIAENQKSIFGLVILLRHAVLVDKLEACEEDEDYETCASIKRELNSLETILKEMNSCK